MPIRKAGFDVVAVPVASLLPHEETIPARVGEIAAEMERDGVQKDPILIDGRTSTVLDGMHRLAGFQRLGVRTAVCCPIDYMSSAVRLRRWLRVFSAFEVRDVGEALAAAGFTAKLPAEEGERRLEGGIAPVAAFLDGDCLVPEGAPATAWFEMVRAVDRASSAKGWERTFSPEDADWVSASRGGRLVLVPKKLAKEDVLEAARGRSLFPCKTSMHSVEPRPVAVNVPLSELERDPEAALRKALEAAETRRLPPNSVYEGRRYQESLLLLNAP